MRVMNDQVRNSTSTMAINQLMPNHKPTPRHPRKACTHEDSAQEMSQIPYHCVVLNQSREFLFQDYIEDQKGSSYFKSFQKQIDKWTSQCQLSCTEKTGVSKTTRYN